MKMFGKKGIFGLFVAVLLVMMWCGEAMAQGKIPQASSFIPSMNKSYKDPRTQAVMNQMKTVVDSVTNDSGKSKTDGKDASEQKTGSSTSGNVEKYVGAKSLSNNFGVNCSGGNIFDQLGCRAGAIGRGLQSVGYIIAGFGLLAFSLAALFGKVKWNVFVTIMFSCFVLSMMVFVINTFTSQGNSAWIAGIQKTDIGNNASVPGDTDKVKVSQSQ